MKYVKHSTEGFIFWTSGGGSISHAEMARFATSRRPGTILSAGFVMYLEGKPQCFGSSDTLGIGHLPTDTQELILQLGMTP